MFWLDTTGLKFPNASRTWRSTRMLMNCRPPELVVCRPPKKLQLDSSGLNTGVVLVVRGSDGSGPLALGPTKYAQMYC